LAARAVDNFGTRAAAYLSRSVRVIGRPGDAALDCVRPSVRKARVSRLGLATGETGEEGAAQEFVLQMPDGGYEIVEERFFLIRVAGTRMCSDGLTQQEVIQQHRWWSLSELEEPHPVVFPKNLTTILESVGIR
jgi:hypothetical protein